MEQQTNQTPDQVNIGEGDDLKNLELWNIDNMNSDFNFLNVPSDTFGFLSGNQIETESPPNSLFTHSKPSPSQSSSLAQSQNLNQIQNQKPNNNKDSLQTNYLLKHYENLLKQNKVSMKEAISSNSQFSPTTNNLNVSSPGSSDEKKSHIQPPRSSASNNPSPLHQQQSPVQQQQSADPKQRTCDHCRRRQSKCVMVPNLLNCIQCETKGIKCTYSESPSNPLLKRNMGMLSSASPQDSSSKRQKFTNNNFDNPNQQKGSLQQQFLQYPRSSFFVGSSSIFDSLLLEKIKLDRIDQVQLNSSLSLRKVSPSVQFILRDDYTDDLSVMTEKAVDYVESLVQPYGPNLVQIYFQIIHHYFPILHKKVFLEKYARSYREFSAPLLATVYSLACKWWEFDPKLAKAQKPDITELNKIAMKTFIEVTERPRLSAVQAGLLLLDCCSENQNNWILMQQVASLAEELGLGLDCQDWKLPKWEKGLRRRLAWAVWVQEKWIALSESRVSHFKIDRNWLVENLTDDDFPEVNNPGFSQPAQQGIEAQNIETGRILFKEFIQLTLILNEIQEQFYTYSALRNLTRIDEVLKAAKPLQFKLRQWYHSLPSSIQLNSNASTDRLNSNGFLHLSYLAAEITLHRRIIAVLSGSSSPSTTSSQINTLSPNNQSSGSSNFPGSPNNPSSSSMLNSNKQAPIQPPPELVKVCRAAATTRLIAIIECVKSIQASQYYSYWHSSTPYSLSLVGIFAAILYVTSSSIQESLVFKDHLTVYRNVLLRLKKNFRPAELALQRIDTLCSQIPGLLNVNTSNNGINIPNSDFASTYNMNTGNNSNITTNKNGTNSLMGYNSGSSGAVVTGPNQHFDDDGNNQNLSYLKQLNMSLNMNPGSKKNQNYNPNQQQNNQVKQSPSNQNKQDNQPISNQKPQKNPQGHKQGKQ